MKPLIKKRLLIQGGLTNPNPVETILLVSSPPSDSDYDTSCLNDPIFIEEVKAAVAANILEL